jgi:hypothetical protein
MVKGEVLDEDEILSSNPWRQREKCFHQKQHLGKYRHDQWRGLST